MEVYVVKNAVEEGKIRAEPLTDGVVYSSLEKIVDELKNKFTDMTITEITSEVTRYKNAESVRVVKSSEWRIRMFDKQFVPSAILLIEKQEVL